jgi:hypothetical protein
MLKDYSIHLFIFTGIMLLSGCGPPDITHPSRIRNIHIIGTGHVVLKGAGMQISRISG